jgi:hypothetical protein
MRMGFILIANAAVRFCKNNPRSNQMKSLSLTMILLSLYHPAKLGKDTMSTLSTFKTAQFFWLAPYDETCVGSLEFDTATPSNRCYEWEMGIEKYVVVAG